MEVAKMTIEGASRECVDRLYTIFTSSEIEVSKDSEGLYSICIPSRNNFNFQYDALSDEVFFTNCSNERGETRSVLIGKDHFFQITLT